MKTIKASSLTADVNTWLTETCQPRILHVFDEACNLVNEHKGILSIVTPQIGNGPFNMVVEDEILFSEKINLEFQVSLSPTEITLGNLTINTVSAKTWNPRPDWEMLYGRRKNILTSLTRLPITNYQSPGLDMPFTATAQGYPSTRLRQSGRRSTTNNLQSLISTLCFSLANADISSAQIITSQLAGLGIGLTPAGDDFIMGAVLATWIVHPLEVAGVLAKEITDTAAPLTTSLSAAWLRSAGRGEAGQVWHEFFDALIENNKSNIHLRINNILAVGETSGGDAMAGFLSVIRSYIAPLSRKEETSSAE